MSLWNQVRDQLRIYPNGAAHALDISAIANYFSILGITDIEWQIQKMKAIFEETVLKVKKDA